MADLSNGVRPRIDGAGDKWAEQHRTELGNRNYMADVDGLAGIFYQNSGNKLFVEYQPDHYKNRNDPTRRFAYVALFDRKQNLDASEQSQLSMQMYMDMTRKLSVPQPKPARFFHVIDPILEEGGDKYLMIEFNIETGLEIKRSECTDKVKDLWASLGLIELRAELAKWLISSESK